LKSTSKTVNQVRNEPRISSAPPATISAAPTVTTGRGGFSIVIIPGAGGYAPIGGGGTRFEPFFEHVESVSTALGEHVLLYLTDGHGSFPAEAPSAPVLWIVPPGGAPDEAFPFGSVVRLLDDGLLDD